MGLFGTMFHLAPAGGRCHPWSPAPRVPGENRPALWKGNSTGHPPGFSPDFPALPHLGLIYHKPSNPSLILHDPTLANEAQLPFGRYPILRPEVPPRRQRWMKNHLAWPRWYSPRVLYILPSFTVRRSPQVGVEKLVINSCPCMGSILGSLDSSKC